jgi:cell division protease FtsH
VNSYNFHNFNTNPYGKKYIEDLKKRKELKTKFEKENNSSKHYKYPISKNYFEEQLKRLNSQNSTIQTNEIMGNNNDTDIPDENNTFPINGPHLRIKLNNNGLQAFGISFNNDDDEDHEDDDYYTKMKRESKEKSDNFEVIRNYKTKFKDVGGYENVKEELFQCVDLLKNYTKYAKYSVRIPKGLVMEGPPGTGKTLLSKAFAGEAGCGFIAVSGSDFQHKYVGVGSSRVKELFELASKNIPCIIFIDEIDAVGRTRSSDGESSSSEKDQTLNSLLVELDGFKNNTGIFMICATNRVDLLDPALTRPGRIDKKISIGLPDKTTRRSIIKIHKLGKPHDNTVKDDDIVDVTEGLSGAQIENLLNEAMLYALRNNRDEFTNEDFDIAFNKMMVGWQPNDHEFTTDIVDHIAIHEMGHAVVGLFSKHHSNMTKVVINFSSPNSPGYTVFESSISNIYTRDALFERLMILLSGRIAEEIFYGVSVTTGALNDFEEALKLAQKMVLYYGMGSNIIYPYTSDKYKELIDNDILELINSAYSYAEAILRKSKHLVRETSEMLKRDKVLKADSLTNLIESKYEHLLELRK